VTTRDLVRHLVVGTNPYWPFSALNKVPYRVALAAMARRMKNRGDVRGLYLRNGLLGGDWVPGISDIDLTLVTGDIDAQPEHAYRTVRWIWAQYDILKRTFPMLGELDILTPKTLPAWSRFAVTGYETRFWKPLVGDRVTSLGYDDAPLRLQFDALNHAVLFYLDFLLPRVLGGARSHVSAGEMRRIGSKVIRYAALATGRTADRAAVSDGVPPSSVAAAALNALDEAVRHVDFSSLWASSPAGARHCIDRAGSDLPSENRPEHRYAVVTGCRVPIVILREGQWEEVDSTLAASQPMVVTPAVFQHIVRCYDPFLYTHLLTCGRVAFGRPVSLPPAPHERSFAYNILVQLQNVLSAARSRGVLPQHAAAFIAGRAFELAVERALFIKTLLACGTVSPWYDELQAERRRRYGDYDARVAEIRQHALRDAGAAGLEAFTLLGGLARELADSVSEANVDARIFRRVTVEHGA
jgi:hypothetical protein